MVLNAKALRHATVEEMLRRFPIVLRGYEGEGEGSGTPPPGGEGSGTPPTPPETKDPETFPREYVEGLRGENAAHRTKAADLQKKIDEYEAAEAERAKAELSEAERAKAEAEEHKTRAEAAENALLDERKRNAIIAEAGKLKFMDPNDALAFVNLEDIQMTDAGVPHKTSVESAVKKIADERKYLISGTGSADGGSRGLPPLPEGEKVKAMQDDIAARGGVPVG